MFFRCPSYVRPASNQEDSKTSLDSEHTRSDEGKIERIKEKRDKLASGSGRKAVSAYDRALYQPKIGGVKRKKSAVNGAVTSSTDDIISIANADSLLLVVIDFETPGWRGCHDEVMELCSTVIKAVKRSDGSYQFSPIGDTWLGLSRTMCINPGVDALRSQRQNSQLYRDARQEEVMMTAFVANLRQTLLRGRTNSAGDVVKGIRAYLVAHNGKGMDFPLLYYAMARAGFTLMTFAELGVWGGLDTYPVSYAAPWSTHITPQVMIPEVQVQVSCSDGTDTPAVDTDCPTSLMDAFNIVDSRRRKPAVTGSGTPAPTDTSEVAHNEEGEGPSGEVLIGDGDSDDERINTGPKKEGGHSQREVYSRLFGCDFEGAHQASHDVKALVSIVTHPLIWGTVVSEDRHVMSWESLSQRAADLAHRRDQHYRGYGSVKSCPICTHGPMRVADPVRDAHFNHVDGWRISFTCVIHDASCPPVHLPTSASFVEDEPTAPKRRRSTAPKKKKAGPAGDASSGAHVVTFHGSVGACTCKATCVKKCPCAAAQVACMLTCRHKARKCVNKHEDRAEDE